MLPTEAIKHFQHARGWNITEKTAESTHHSTDQDLLRPNSIRRSLFRLNPLSGLTAY